MYTQYEETLSLHVLSFFTFLFSTICSEYLFALFLCQEMILCGITANPPHREITKTAIGAENSVSWRYQHHTIDAVKDLKLQGFVVYAIEQTSNSVFLQNMVFPNQAVAFVFGNEIDGVDAEVISLCDGVIEIPQLGTKHSFNIAVSCGMVLWEYARTRV